MLQIPRGKSSEEDLVNNTEPGYREGANHEWKAPSLVKLALLGITDESDKALESARYLGVL